MDLSKLLSVLFVVLIFGCQRTDENGSSVENPPAKGFNLANSDPAAVELADSIMKAMGGRKAWDQTKTIAWDFGNRKLIWDKHDGKVRIESSSDSTIYLVDLNTMKGRVQVRGKELTEPDSLSKMLQRGRSIWINDSYWLVMPFKLKDTGVTLKYLGEDTIANGTRHNILQLTFSNVGDTPDNKYLIYVDLKDNLIKQWAYFQNAEQDSASHVWPFDNYKAYGEILLSADRSDGRGPKNVRVNESYPEKTFTEF